tara:strand:+ start:35 stop:364 length:330 start_codon:yes stop_codon:yes gene_type:complete
MEIMTLKTFYQKVLVLTFIVLTQFINSCNKKSECEDSHSAKLVNMTGLDGCSWMIELRNGTKLEPTNLNDFSIHLEENKKIWVVYHTATQMASICMHGEIVTIDCISER